MIADWRNRRVTVMGLGRFGGGAGVARWLATAGADVLVTDQKPAEALAEGLAGLAGLPVRLRLGGHDQRDFCETDLVVVNPAVPERSPYLEAARSAGVPVTTEINLFVERCPARTIGVTGSVGKSTVTSMIGHVLECFESLGKTWLGGNLGGSLLDALPQIREHDTVVLELSSFQLERTPLVSWSPGIAVITNLDPNHIDWHGSFEAYAAAKQNICRFQKPGRDALVLGCGQSLDATAYEAAGRGLNVWRYGLEGDVPGAWPADTAGASTICPLRWDVPPLAAPGLHNRENAAAALTVASLLNQPADAAIRALANFEGLPHRLHRVGVFDGVTYVNDSKSSTPQAALTAMRSFDAPLLVILGGYDKGADLTEMARFAAQRARLVACLGQTGPRIAAAVRDAGGRAELCDDLPAAVALCRAHAAPGDTILLSPGCASWGMFADFRERGERFAALARGGAANPTDNK